jgi:NAD(P)-dependent dehydrogenase (short-subunit alcohol dehydrogenase family)
MFDYGSMFDLTGKTALVVGAGSGIGEASAHGLAAFGAEVYAADVNAEAAEMTAERIRSGGGKGVAVGLDMLDSASVGAVAERLGAPYVLVSTPSINVRKPVLEITDEEFDRIVDVNLKGTFRLIREFGRGMAERGSGASSPSLASAPRPSSRARASTPRPRPGPSRCYGRWPRSLVLGA